MSKTINMPIRFDVPLIDQCSHGKLWTEFCRDCRIVWLKHDLEEREKQLSRDKAELQHLLGATSETVTAQHDETGRMWEGPRDQLPPRYSVVNTSPVAGCWDCSASLFGKCDNHR